MSEAHLISAGAAGGGFAAAIPLAEQSAGAKALELDGEELAQALALCREVRTTLAEQAEGWKRRPLFERQWVVRDFKKRLACRSSDG
jgi:hypothetical protein